MADAAQKFNFIFFRFIGPKDNRTTELVRDYNQADGMRSLVDPGTVPIAHERVHSWASGKGIIANAKLPYPSVKHPGKVWIEYSFSGLTL